MRGWLNNSSNLFYKIILFCTYWFFKIFYRHRIYGVESFYEGAALIAANHTSFYDPPLLAISTPCEVHFLARKTLFDSFFLSSLIRRLNAHPVSGKAQDIAVFKTMVRLMKKDNKAIIFPEGKRSKTGELGPIKPGIALLLSRTGAAVIPAYLHGTFKVWPPGKKLPRLFGKTACVFGKPLHFQKDTKQEDVIAQIEKSILFLKKWYDDGAKGSPN
jgi:1-acyl-sn-glycerol-3-phosphate acyltransferase